MTISFANEILEPLRNPHFPRLFSVFILHAGVLLTYWTGAIRYRFLSFFLRTHQNAHHFHFHHHAPLIPTDSITPSHMMSSHSALSDAALSELTYKLRYANARYGQIAFELRCRIKFTRTHHAQRRAFRSGLRVDIAKAKGCPMTAISVRPLPVLDTTRSPSPIMLSPCLPESHNELGLEIPDIIVSSPDVYAQPRERLVIRIPPLASLHNDVYYHEQYDMPAPGAPRIHTKELPEECEMEDICSSRSSSSASSCSPLTPVSPLK
ncbi:hypothetical protein DFH29DRAFT_440994 [Suillus ampliporus]|nr:hypothetical protein DFH29DRAFT_440994 [Suillus ampliporus]